MFVFQYKQLVFNDSEFIQFDWHNREKFSPMNFFSVVSILFSLVFAKETVIESACILAKTEFEKYQNDFKRDWRRFNYGYNPGK